jgi:hypothetical protein
VAAANEAGKFAYNRFFAVGLFRWVQTVGGGGEGRGGQCGLQSGKGERE